MEVGLKKHNLVYFSSKSYYSKQNEDIYTIGICQRVRS